MQCVEPICISVASRRIYGLKQVGRDYGVRWGQVTYAFASAKSQFVATCTALIAAIVFPSASDSTPVLSVAVVMPETVGYS